MRQPILAPLLGAAFALAACSHGADSDTNRLVPSPGVVCTEMFQAGLVVEVRDGLTGAPAAVGSIGTIRDGAYTETLEVEGGAQVPPEVALRLVGAWERRSTHRGPG